MTRASVSLQGSIWASALPDVLWAHICFPQVPAVSAQMGAASWESHLGCFQKQGLSSIFLEPSGVALPGESNHQVPYPTTELVVGERRCTQAPLSPTTCSESNWASLTDSMELKSIGTCSVALFLRHQVTLDIGPEPSSFYLLYW